MTLTGMLVALHIGSGSVAVVGMAMAMVYQKGGPGHRRSGQVYVAGMTAALLLAIIVSILKNDVFLLLIGLFSGYFVYTGWRLAKVRNGARSQLDHYATWLMLLVSAVMAGYGLFLLVTGNTMGIVLLVFSGVAALPAGQDYRLGGQWPTGKERIKRHLTRMGGASIATLTAVFVVNVDTSPEFLAWLLPTFVITPIIVYWMRKVAGGAVSV